MAAILIHVSHVLDCMDRQMARYRNVSSNAGAFFDKDSDQIKVILWFGAVAYAAHLQSGDILPVFVAFAGVTIYSLRGYVKYVSIYSKMCDDKDYLERSRQAVLEIESARKATAVLGHGLLANLRWFVAEQRKFLVLDEGVLIFLLSVALVLNAFMPMLWVFAITQALYGVGRAVQRGR